MVLLVLPGSISDLLKKIRLPLDRRDVTDLILVNNLNDVFLAYIVWFQDRFRVFIPPFFWLVLWVAADVVSFAVLPSRGKEYLQVVSGDLLPTSRLSLVQHLCHLEEFQDLVIRYNLNLVFCSLQILSPSLDTVDYCL